MNGDSGGVVTEMAHPDNTGDRNSRTWKKRLWLRKRRGGLRSVPATRARSRLVKLSGLGVGRKAVHEFTGINHRALARIKNGETKYVRRETERLILGVPFNAHCDRALIDAKQTWDRINHLIDWDMGFTKSEIGRRLGVKQRKTGWTDLQIGKEKVTARMAMKVEKLYRDAIGAGG